MNDLACGVASLKNLDAGGSERAAQILLESIYEFEPGGFNNEREITLKNRSLDMKDNILCPRHYGYYNTNIEYYFRLFMLL